MNPELEKAIRLADHIELAEVMAKDALQREESCGGHYREEFVTEEGEAKRDDENFKFVGVWEYKGEGQDPIMHKEELNYEFIKVQQRNYK
jgi:succinate dehydrogenase / fumarate reductase flavoprotein subunit